MTSQQILDLAAGAALLTIGCVAGILGYEWQSVIISVAGIIMIGLGVRGEK